MCLLLSLTALLLILPVQRTVAADTFCNPIDHHYLFPAAALIIQFLPKQNASLGTACSSPTGFIAV
jgi:hypothetical protein